jgi:hypothetical protein
MGAPKTKAVGGGNAVNTADAFNSFLLDIIGGNPNARQGAYSTAPRPTSSPFGLMDRMLTRNANMNLPSAGGGVNNADFQTSAFRNAINTQLGGGMADSGELGDYFTAMRRGAGGSSVGAQDYSYAPHDLLNVDMNSPEFAALRTMQGRQRDADLATLSAKYSAMGAGGRGTGAAYATGNYLAEANPRNILAQGQLARDIQGLDLQNFGANAQNRQALLGLGQNQNQLDQGWAQMQAQTGLGLNAQNMQSIQNILAQLFGAFNQSNALGTPSRQMIQTPNAWQQFTGGLGDIAGIAGSIAGLPGMRGKTG